MRACVGDHGKKYVTLRGHEKLATQAEGAFRNVCYDCGWTKVGGRPYMNTIFPGS